MSKTTNNGFRNSRNEKIIDLDQRDQDDIDF